MTSTLLLWPPPTCENKYDGQRVDLLGLIPPNRFDDFSVPNREHQIAGVTLRADRVIMDRERYPDCERSTQHKLSDDIQASCREQGHCISVKEWADKNQHRGTLRLRLRCRSSACRFQFQLNWDSKASVWYISRRRCGTFVHTCQPVKGAQSSTSSNFSNKRRLHESKGSSNKRARCNGEGVTTNTSTTSTNTINRTETNNTSSSTSQAQAAPEPAALDALDSARSLLDLSRAPSSPKPVSPTNEENEKPAKNSPQTSPSSSATPDFTPVRLGDRLFLQPMPESTAVRPNDLSMLAAAQQKLALLRGNGLASSLDNLPPAVKAALQQRCIAFPALSSSAAGGQNLLQTDPRLLHTGLLLNGGSFASLS